MTPNASVCGVPFLSAVRVYCPPPFGATHEQDAMTSSTRYASCFTQVSFRRCSEKGDMYSDGERKTVSELQREAEATRNQIVKEARQLERIKKATAKTQFSIDQLFRFFAREVETEEEKKTLIDVLMTNTPDVHIETVPLLPIATAIANGRMNNVRRIYATDSRFVDDSSLILFTHVLRFSPQAAQIDWLDISGTAVTEKSLCVLLETITERDANFTLIAKNVSIPSPMASNACKQRFAAALASVRTKKHCVVQLE